MDHRTTTTTSAEEDQQRTLRRLRRDNHFLRQQVLRLQEGRRAMEEERGLLLSSSTAPRENPTAAGKTSTVDVGVHQTGDEVRSVHQNPSIGPILHSDDDTAALCLRMRTLQRQNERERLRRQQIERELRREVEMLRHSLEAQSTPPQPNGEGGHLQNAGAMNKREEDTLLDTSPPRHATAAPHFLDSKFNSQQPSLRSPTSSVSSSASRGAAALLMGSQPSDRDPQERSRQGISNPLQTDVLSPSASFAEIATASEKGPLSELPLTGPVAGGTVAAVPLSAASPADIQRMYQASVDRYTAVSRGVTGGTFTGFNFPPSSPSPAPASASGADGNGLGEDAESLGSRQHSSWQASYEADALMRRAADRRAVRRERLARCSASAVSSMHQSDVVGLPPHKEAGEKHKTEKVTASGEGGDNAPEADASAHYNLANPNQIGVEISETRKDRAWYLKQVIAQSLLQAIRPQSRQPQPVHPQGEAAEATETPGLATKADGKEVSPQPWMKALMEDDSDDSLSSCSVDGTTRGGGGVNGGVMDGHEGGPKQMHKPPRGVPMQVSSPAPLADAPSSMSTAGAASTQGCDTAFVYRDINRVAMQRAISDSITMHFRCRHNRPFLTPNYREGYPSGSNTSGGGSGNRLGCFADENSDPSLLEAFSPPHMSNQNAALYTNRTDNEDWDDDFGGDSSSAYDVRVPNNCVLSPGRLASGMRDRNGSGLHQYQHHSSGGGNKKKTGNASGEISERYREDEILVQFHAPVIFSQVRSFLRLDDSYLRVAVEQSVWRQSASPGKSKTTLYYFADFVAKSMKESEVSFFQRRYLPHYVQYCERNPNTLLPRFYAMLSVKWLKQDVKMVFILMQNVFTTRYYIHRIYDVKGSTVGRSAFTKTTTTDADGVERTTLSAPRTVFGALLLKDNDLPPQLVICGAYQRAILLAQFRSDVNFLSALNIVDYSCMIGVRSRVFSAEQGPSKTIVLRRRRPAAHYQPKRTKNKDKAAAGGQRRRNRGNRYGSDSGAGTGCGLEETSTEDDDNNDDGGESFIAQNVADITSSGVIGVGASSALLSNYGYEFGSYKGGFASSPAAADAPVGAGLLGGDGEEVSDDLFICLRGCDGGLLSLPIYAPGDDTTAREDVYYLGIIDVLQEYNSIKKFENFAKGLLNDRTQISVIPPKDYAERLYKVIERIAT